MCVTSFHICVSFIPSISAARAGCYRISYSASNRIWSQRLLDDCKYLFAPRVQLKINFRRRLGAESRALTHSNRIFHPFLPVLSWKRASSLLVFGPILKVFAGKSKKRKARKPNDLLAFLGGAGGIRTHGRLPYTWFRVRTVMTTSIPLHGIFASPMLRKKERKGGENKRKYWVFKPQKTQRIQGFFERRVPRSPNVFESAPLWPLRYLSVYVSICFYLRSNFTQETFGEKSRRENREIVDFSFWDPLYIKDSR